MLDIRVDEKAGVVRFKGRLDAAQSRRVEEVLEGLEATTWIDCLELDYISSAGLGILFAAHKRLADAGQQLGVQNLSPHLREVFAIAGFDRFFEIR
jgi:anti-sigma B factor antagonist